METWSERFCCILASAGTRRSSVEPNCQAIIWFCREVSFWWKFQGKHLLHLQLVSWSWFICSWWSLFFFFLMETNFHYMKNCYNHREFLAHPNPRVSLEKYHLSFTTPAIFNSFHKPLREQENYRTVWTETYNFSSLLPDRIQKEKRKHHIFKANLFSQLLTWFVPRFVLPCHMLVVMAQITHVRLLKSINPVILRVLPLNLHYLRQEHKLSQEPGSIIFRNIFFFFSFLFMHCLGKSLFM